MHRGSVSRAHLLDDGKHGPRGRRRGFCGMSLPGLRQLESTPEILRLLMEGLSDDDTKWKPAPNRFSIAEVLEHLSHVEGHCFRSRIERMVEEDNPAIEEYDQEALFAAGQYSGREAEDSFDHFEEQRE